MYFFSQHYPTGLLIIISLLIWELLVLNEKKMHNIKVENYVYLVDNTEDFSLGHSLSDNIGSEEVTGW